VKLLREEKIKFYQRAKVTDALLGDNNTKYFQMIANGKHRKKRIFSLDSDNGVIEGQANLKSYITQFYKGLFGEPEQTSFSLELDRTEDIKQVSEAENDILTAPFSEKEVKAAIFQMEHNKASGPDGFPVEFYQKF
jgi:excinuclease UvrABC nuclease subunit